jgi:hypothetical protein
VRTSSSSRRSMCSSSCCCCSACTHVSSVSTPGRSRDCGTSLM